MTQIPKKNVLLVDDHAMILEGVSRVINESKEFEVTQMATSVTDALSLLNTTHFHILITDYNLPDKNGLYLVRECRKLYPELKIIVLSMHDEAHLITEILKEGIHGYILKKDSLSELNKALESVIDGKVYLSADINAMLIDGLKKQTPQKLLTSREREILGLIIEEYSNKQIADKLFISERTVETHRKNIFRKSKTNNVIGLTKFAYKNNLIV
jgi:DNA-binding NarL/FixJ family response regulator